MSVGDVLVKVLVYGGAIALLTILILRLVWNKRDNRSPWRKLHDGRP